MSMTLADILAPIAPEQLFAEYYDKQPLHVREGVAVPARQYCTRATSRDGHPLPRQDGTAAARFALTSRAAQLGQRLSKLTRNRKAMEVLGKFTADYRYRCGGNDLLADAAPAATEGEGSATFHILTPGTKAPSATLPLAPAEAEAAGWLLSRNDVAEAKLRAAHPAIDATGLLAKLAGAGVLAPT
ncbi:hypothetical protein HMPREF9946_04043 [Acetobacteraceae bacterium AT-5844]|nr:hypothetical protein HMPREF9946_04043 [Acetobacteraceae bacterium AT-5844]